MPHTRQKRCFAAPVLKVYWVRSSAPDSRRKRVAGTIRCRKPLMRQIEQLQSSTSSAAGASTSNRTRRQWQPPRCVTSCEGLACGSIRTAYSTLAVALALAGVALAGVALAGVALAAIAVLAARLAV